METTQQDSSAQQSDNEEKGVPQPLKLVDFNLEADAETPMLRVKQI